MPTTRTSLFRNPSLLVLALLQFCIMAAYATQLSSLEIFLTDVMHFTTKYSYTIVAVFLSPMLVLPLISGYIGDRYLGHFRAVIIGLLLLFLGFALIALFAEYDLFWGLSCIQCGISFIAPNFFVLIGRRMPIVGTGRDNGFIVNYAALNAGALLSIFLSGYIIDYFGYAALYWYSASISVIALALFFIFKKYITTEKEKKSAKSIAITVIIILAVIVCSRYLLMYAMKTNILLIVAGIIGFGLLAYFISGARALTQKKIAAYLILSILCVGFITFYYLTPSLVLHFIEKNTRHYLFNFHVPPESLYTFEPIFVIIFALVSSKLWVFLKNRSISINIPKKIFIGLVFLGLGFFILFIASAIAPKNGIIASAWFIVFFACQALGEVCVIPIGYAMVGVLAPKEHEGVFQGVWALTLGLSLGISSFIARASAYPTKLPARTTTPMYSGTFLAYALILTLVALVTLTLIPRLTRIFVQTSKSR